jgi:hypothetical protein
MLETSRRPRPLGLRAGDRVVVKSRHEILATLDRSGALDGLPFMPEMFAFCGRQFTVVKRADKTCDTIKNTGLRRMSDTVHLDGTRCDGSAHAGCEAACQIFWKEAWLRPVADGNGPADWASGSPVCTEEDVRAATRRPAPDGASEPLFRCQATDLLEASTPLRPWGLRHYVRDIRSGNASVAQVVKAMLWNVARSARTRVRGYRLQIWLFNLIQRWRGGAALPDLQGPSGPTPTGKLALRPGERVQVKDVAEIRATLSPSSRNRGLYFDVEMTPFCGQTFTVRSRVNRIVDDKTGRLINLPGDCVILENVFCTGRYHGCCPRAIYPYWREIWLRRVTSADSLEPTGR